MHTPARSRLLTVRQAANRLGVHEDTVWRRIRRGDLPAVQLGGRGTAVRIDERQFEAWLEASQMAAHNHGGEAL